MNGGYIDPTTATHVRIHRDPDGVGGWLIDAADDAGGYTEACWDSRAVIGSEAHERTWERIPSVEDARELVPAFIEEHVPHLAGKPPRVL